MIEDNELPQDVPTDTEVTKDTGVDIGRRDALRNIGALAGAAPALAVLLSPSASRALGGGGSPCEDPCGSGNGTAPGRTPNNTGAPGGDSGLLGREN